LIILTAFIGFLLYTSWVAITREVSLLTYLTSLRANSWGAQILADLFISLCLVCTWLVRDARGRSRRAWPWVVATPVVGSLAPLLYLVVRELEKLKDPHRGQLPSSFSKEIEKKV
jgi:hypothetical protein